jgi:ribonuclease E
MRMLMPSHGKNVRLYSEALPVFTRYGIESQLDAMFTPVMQLRSGGYIVINQAEALVAIDVNSGRATREHHIEDTALKTNLEAAEEIARQLRLRDLAGLIVIDFIDMDEKRNNRAVERRLKECLRHDRARIQVGHISHFGLLEMSRQRIRSSVLESSTEKCANCGGTGHVRSVASVALQLLRALDEMLLKGATHNVIVRTRSDTALYLLNHKRAHLRALEERFRIFIVVTADAGMVGQVPFLIDRGEQVHSPEQAKALAAEAPAPVALEQSEEPQEELEDEHAATEAVLAEDEGESGDTLGDDEDEDRGQAVDQELTQADGQEHGGARKKRRRRRSRRGGEPDTRHVSADTRTAAPTGEPHDEDPDSIENAAGAGDGASSEDAEPDGEAERHRRRRGRRGGRRNRREREHATAPETADIEPELVRAATDLDQPQDNMEPALAHEVEAHALPRIEPHPDVEDAGRSAMAGPETDGLAETSSEAARRRSTVREPAFASLRETPAEGQSEGPRALGAASVSPEPVVSSPEESKTAERPRRSGWWSKRVLGRH